MQLTGEGLSEAVFQQWQNGPIRIAIANPGTRDSIDGAGRLNIRRAITHEDQLVVTTCRIVDMGPWSTWQKLLEISSPLNILAVKHLGG